MLYQSWFSSSQKKKLIHRMRRGFVTLYIFFLLLRTKVVHTIEHSRMCWIYILSNNYCMYGDDDISNSMGCAWKFLNKRRGKLFFSLLKPTQKISYNFSFHCSILRWKKSSNRIYFTHKNRKVRDFFSLKRKMEPFFHSKEKFFSFLSFRFSNFHHLIVWLSRTDFSIPNGSQEFFLLLMVN